MKYFFSLFLGLGFTMSLMAQENKFLDREFWKGNPSIEEVDAAIAEGNDITEHNRFYFDGPTYAILENVDAKTITYIIAKKGNGVDKLTHDGRIYLHWAAYAKNLKLVQELLQKGSNASAIDAHGYSVINFAASTGVNNREIYDALLTKSADLRTTNHDGANALLLASSRASSFDIIQYFVDKGLPLNSTDDLGNGAFQYAARSGNITLLKTLVEKGLDYKIINNAGENALFMAAQGTRRNQNTKEVFEYLETLDLSNQLVNNEGQNLLHVIALRNKNVDLFGHFIESGLSAELKDNKGVTPFMKAASGNDLQVVQLLGKEVTKINETDDKGRSALMLAVEKNSPEVVEFLIKKGADVTAVDKEGNSVAFYLIQNYSERNAELFDDKLDLLKATGLKLTQTQNNGNTLLHLAAKENNLALLKRLETAAIDINQKNDEGTTALHLAAMSSENDEVLKYLIAQGADISSKTDFDETVYDLAKENELLQERQISLDFLKAINK